jgi:hypothetical protein
MKKMPSLCIAFFILGFNTCILSQDISTKQISQRIIDQKDQFGSNKMVGGAALSLSMDLFNSWQVRLGFSTFVGSNITKKLDFTVIPSVRFETVFYYGGLGTNGTFKKLHWDMFLSPTCTVGSNRLKAYGRPLYSIGSFNTYSQFDPTDWGVTLSSNIIYRNDEKRIHRNGTIFVGIKNFQLTYSNDNTPFNWLQCKKFPWLVDTYDRWYTGSLSIGLFTAKPTVFTQFIVGYDRFTGFEDKSFEMAGQFMEDIVSHRDATQFNYNQARWVYQLGFGHIANIKYNISGASDLQEYIHYLISRDPRHEVVNKRKSHGVGLSSNLIKPIK